MAVADVHPCAEELAAFTAGTLGDDAYASLEAHLAACPSCQERAAVAPGDPLIELLRRAHAHTARQADTAADTAAQLQTPELLATTAEAVPVAPAALAESDRPETPGAVPPELARHERYRVVRLLGEGGMGAVYEAEHRVMQRPVALKVINRAYTANAATVERFRREVRAAARLSHPNVVTTYDAEDAGDTHFLVMEYVAGVSLARWVNDRGPLPVPEACAYVRQAALGLQHAHERGMVHRDVKPANLILVASPVASAPGVVKVLDFGLAMLAGERGDRLTDTDVVMGTPDYMAPEQAADPRTADIRADVYSLGCTLYYLLTGKVPYPAPTLLLKILAHREQPLPPICQVRPEVPARLADVLARMLAKKPDDRYATPGEVAAALEPFTKSHPAKGSSAIALPVGGESPRRPRRRLLLAALAAMLLAGVMIAGAVAVYRIETDEGELVITTESDDVKVVIRQSGKLVRIIDAKTDEQMTLALRSGVYELELKEAPEGLKLSIDKATLTRGETVLAKIQRVPPEPFFVWSAKGHIGAVCAVALSGDTRRAYSAGDDKVIRVWDTATGAEVGRLEGHAARVLSLALSPNGRILLSGSGDATIRAWETASGKELRRLEGVTGECWGIAFSPDGKYAIAEGGFNKGAGHFGLWEVASGKRLRRFTGQANCLAFHPDGRHFLLGGSGGRVELREIDTGRLVRNFVGHTTWIRAVAISADGSRALSVSGGKNWGAPNPQPVENDSTVRCWGLEEGVELCEFHGHTHTVMAAAFVAGQTRILSGSLDKTVRLWDLATEKELMRWGLGEAVFCLVASPNGQTGLIGTQDGWIRQWRLPASASAK